MPRRKQRNAIARGTDEGDWRVLFLFVLITGRAAVGGV